MTKSYVIILRFKPVKPPKHIAVQTFTLGLRFEGLIAFIAVVSSCEVSFLIAFF